MSLTKVHNRMISGAMVSLGDYGADPTGATDSTTAINAWVSYLCANNLDGYAPPGKYLFSSTILINAKCSITGGGFSENSGNGSVTEFLKSSAFSGNGFQVTAPAVYLANFAIEGQSGNGGDGLSIESNTVCLENISIHNQGNDGFRFGVDAGGGANLNKFHARNLVAHSNHRHGVFLNQPDGLGSADCNGGIISGLNLFNNGGEGLSIANAAANSIVGIVAQNNVSFGVGLHSGSSQNAFFGGDINENNDTGGGGPYDLQIDAAAEQNAFYSVAMNPTKINVEDPETLILTEDNPASKNVYIEYNSVNTGTTQIPFDDSTPTSSEGVQFMEASIDRGWALCGYLINVTALISPSSDANITMALFEDSDVNAISAVGEFVSSGKLTTLRLQHKINIAASGNSVYRVRIGGDAAATYTFNGVAGARKYGGAGSSSISIQQINSN